MQANMAISGRSDSVCLLLSNEQKPWPELAARFFWALCSSIVFPLPGRQFSPLRVALLRLFGAKIGSRVLICSRVHVWFPWRLSIGDFSAIGRSVEIYNYENVRIGSNTVISQYSYLCTASHDYCSRSMDFFSRPISVGDSAWVASGAMICPGVVIPDGVVVGARSLVASDLPEWTVCAGIPAKKIKNRIIE